MCFKLAHFIIHLFASAFSLHQFFSPFLAIGQPGSREKQSRLVMDHEQFSEPAGARAYSGVKQDLFSEKRNPHYHHHHYGCQSKNDSQEKGGTPKEFSRRVDVEF